MKATIHRTDGTWIEAEGTPEEIAKLAGAIVSNATFFPWNPPPASPFQRPDGTFGLPLSSTAAAADIGYLPQAGAR